MSEFERVASVEDVPPGGRVSIFVDDTPALLVRVGDEFFAIEDVCSHDGQPLTNGPVGCDCSIICPRHGAKFNLRTGAAMCMPAVVGIATFEAQVRDGSVFVRTRD
jgi:3-phenylpropionate/trans-cinnamate dioxygenase ferredoxin component